MEDQVAHRGDDCQFEIVGVDRLDAIGGAISQPADRSAIGLVSHHLAGGQAVADERVGLPSPLASSGMPSPSVSIAYLT